MKRTKLSSNGVKGTKLKLEKDVCGCSKYGGEGADASAADGEDPREV